MRVQCPLLPLVSLSQFLPFQFDNLFVEIYCHLSRIKSKSNLDQNLRYRMTSFMIRDILNLTPDTVPSNTPPGVTQTDSSPSSLDSVTKSRGSDVSRDHRVAPEKVSCLAQGPREEHHPKILQNWSRNKMKVRTVFTDIQR